MDLEQRLHHRLELCLCPNIPSSWLSTTTQRETPGAQHHPAWSTVRPGSSTIQFGLETHVQCDQLPLEPEQQTASRRPTSN